MIEKVGREVKEVIWRTVPRESREMCRVPEECTNTGHWEDERVENPA